MSALKFSGLLIFPASSTSLSSSVCLPIKSVVVHVEVRAWTVATTAQLCYQNNLGKAVECHFVFPLSDKAAIYRLDADIAGKKITAQCKPRKEVEQIYIDAFKSGQVNALKDNKIESPDVFQTYLGNLPEDQVATLTVGIVQPLHRDARGALEVVLPTVLNPRYLEQADDVAKLSSKKHLNSLSYSAISTVAYSMTFDAKVNLGGYVGISEIVAVNDNDRNKIKATFSEDSSMASVVLNGTVVHDHDFGFRIMPTTPLSPVVFTEPGVLSSDSSTKNWLSYDIAAVWFDPECAQDKRPGVGIVGDEYWLVVDRSGSMEGQKMKDAKAALILFVKSLPIGCKFNIIGFGSKFVALSRTGTLPYSEDNIAKAIDYATNLEANLGGTQIQEPLRYIYAKPKPITPGARQFIVLLTDGEVCNTDIVIDLARKNCSTSRVFTIGIGEGASTALVNGLARVSGGVSEFVRDASDRLQAKVIGLLKAATNPTAENVSIHWNIFGGKVLSVIPQTVRSAAYPGRPVIQYALIERNHKNTTGVAGHACLTAVVGGKLVEYKLPIALLPSAHACQDDPMPLHRLAAKIEIQELTDKGYSLDYDEINRQLVAISLATGILCEDTAFVAVEAGSTSNNNLLNDQDADGDGDNNGCSLSTQLPTFYGRCLLARQSFNRIIGGRDSRKVSRSSYGNANNLSSGALASATDSSLNATFNENKGPPTLKRSKTFTNAIFLRKPNANATNKHHLPATLVRSGSFIRDVGKKISTLLGQRGSLSLESRNTPASSKSCPVSLEKLVIWQKLNGSWNLTADLAEILCRKVDEVRAVCLRCLTDIWPTVQYLEEERDSFLATLIAVGILRRQFSDEKDEWLFIEQKAISYLTGFSGFSPSHIEDVVKVLCRKRLL